MNRRKYLTALGATTASLGLSGCTGILGGGDSNTDETTTTDTGTSTTESALEDQNTTDTITTEGEQTTTNESTTSQTTTTEQATSTPEVDLTFEQDDDSYFIITHNGGDAITDETTSKVNVVVNGKERFAIVSDDGNGQLDYPYEEGDKVSVITSSPYAAIRVYWVSEDGSEEVLLGEE